MSNLTKNYLYNIVSLLTGVLFPFITFPYISRILMPEYLGKISFVQSLTNYFITLALLGIPAYGIRELSRAKVSQDKREFSKNFTELLVISLVMSIVSFLLFFSIIMISQKLNDVKELLYIYSFQVIFAFLNLDYFFIALEKHKRRTMRSVILRFISLALILILVKKPTDYIKYGFILVFPELLARIIDIYLCKDYIDLNIRKLNLKKHFKPLFTIFLYVFSVGIYVNLDATMLGIMKTETEVGLYTTGSKLVRMVIPIMSVLGTVMAPKIIGYIKNKDKDKIYDTMDKFMDFNIILGIPATFLMIYLSKDIILLISGDKFIDSNLTMKIISAIIIFLPVGTFFGGQLLLPNDKEKLVFKVAITGMIFNVIFNFILIPKFSIEGAAFATAFTEILICLYRGYEVKKIYPDYIFFSKERLNYMGLGLGAFLCIFLLKNMITENSLYNIIFFSSIYGVIYFGGLLLLKDKNITTILKKIKVKKESVL
ncbi:flippase [Candidatus Cetobacterium colombiensis]|uniref:Flippase n=1 Tax=Candidatus Cetobacterium colombiensis TaxID=3073100 RepID=A0ABU4W8S9_9FUSO|nr:flippase [Candidatus Cetobacterium colombiensis]MDX8334913.1 flippase [Candidatus Cetobacterium colombiensis]